MSRYSVATLVAVALTVGAAGCGSSASKSVSSAASSIASSASTAATSAATSAASSASSAASSALSGTLSESADPSGALKFTRSSLTAKAGTVTIHFTNMSPLMHNMTIQEGTSGAVVGATPTFQGGTKTLTVNLKKGTYTFYCSVPGHRAAGMQGTLTVT